MGPEVLRELACVPEGAETGAFREIRQDDRQPLGGNRSLLPPREQGLSGLCRGTQQ